MKWERCREFGEQAGGRDSTDFAAAIFREPEISIGTGGYGFGLTVGSWDRKFGHYTGYVDAPDFVCAGFGEPEGMIGAARDAGKTAICSRNGVISSKPVRGHSSYLICAWACVPEIAIGTG